MVKEPTKTRAGQSLLFSLAIMFVIVCVGAGIFYLIPGVYHPFSKDTATETHAHLKYALVFFGGAVLGLIVMRFTWPPQREVIVQQ